MFGETRIRDVDNHTVFVTIYENYIYLKAIDKYNFTSYDKYIHKNTSNRIYEETVIDLDDFLFGGDG